MVNNPSIIARRLNMIVPLALALLAIALTVFWSLNHEAPDKFIKRVPGADRIGVATAAAAVDMHGKLTHGDGVAASQPAELANASWPRFRGSNFDNISHDPATAGWVVAKAGPTTAWTINVGEGYAGPAVFKGRAYLLDYDQANRADCLRCLSLADGREIWNHAYAVDVKRNHGMSRTVPAVTEKYIVSMGPKCDVLCLDSDTGAYRWGIDLVHKFNTKVPPWYAGQCPLIDGDRAIIAPGGTALMVAVDCASGNIVWQMPNPLGWEMTHSSIIPVTIAGQKQYVYCGSGGVIGVGAEDGQLLWQTSDWKVGMATVPTPVIIDSEEHTGSVRLFMSGGYGAGSAMLRVEKRQKVERRADHWESPGPSTLAAQFSELPFRAQVLYRLDPTVFGCEQQTPTFYKGHLYGVIPGGQLVCLDVDKGKPVWVSKDRFGIGPNMIADDKIYLLNDTGVLTIAAASPTAYQPLGHWTVLEEGHEAWGPMAPAGGRLLVRDLRRLACIDLLEAPQ